MCNVTKTKDSICLFSPSLYDNVGMYTEGIEELFVYQTWVEVLRKESTSFSSSNLGKNISDPAQKDEK